MPFANLKDARLHYDLSGLDNAPVLVLSNSLGADFSMWNPQLPAFSKTFRLLRYDTRGHGQSSATPGPYTIEQLARDVIALLDALHFDRVHFCGLSMGGLIGLSLAANAPRRLHKIVLSNTAAKIGTAESWNARIAAIQIGGMPAVSAAIVERWFTTAFRQREPALVNNIQRRVEATPPDGYIACCAALRDIDLRDRLAEIRVPTLVIAGAHDPATPPAGSHFLAEHIQNARIVELNAAHLSNIEDAAHFAAEVLAFLNNEEGKQSSS
jgi:3-oxoadipate enol-lactonase